MTKELQQIGKGLFSTVYKAPNNRVLIRSEDYTKECMSMGWGFDSSFFPKVKREDYGFYSMKYYPKCTAPKKQLNSKSYNDYKELRGLFQNTLNPANKYDGFDLWRDKFSTVKNISLKNALIEAIDGLSNYGSDICFEISPRNISFTKSGKLILLDVFFFRNQADKLRG